MNLYFLVEGRRTEAKVYPAWLSYLVPPLVRVKRPSEALHNNYFVFSSEGFPSIITEYLPTAVEEVNSIPRYTHLVICLDAEESTVDERITEIKDHLSEKDLRLVNARLEIIVQNRCMETWLLGNRRVFQRNPQGDPFRAFVSFYNVSRDDPELMGIFPGYQTHAQFHSDYLTKMLAEKWIFYSKSPPKPVLDEAYLNELIQRTADHPDHLRTFQTFLHFCASLRSQIH